MLRLSLRLHLVNRRAKKSPPVLLSGGGAVLSFFGLLFFVLAWIAGVEVPTPLFHILDVIVA
jgi:hypothetical protein